jgi:predicted Rossmann fold nucleotide-binding protein DprA/Smf involved in DNA uptake
VIVGIVGSREFEDVALVDRIVRGFAASEEGATIVSGGARGADSLVREACRRWGFHFCLEDESDPHGLAHLPLPLHFCEMKADWKKNGKRAGFLRNERLVRHVQMVIALFAPGPLSSGTSHTVRLAREAGLRVHTYHEGRWAK